MRQEKMFLLLYQKTKKNLGIRNHFYGSMQNFYKIGVEDQCFIG